MTPEIQAKIEEILNFLLSSIEATKNFAIEQAPPLIHEIWLFHLVWHGALLAVGSAVLVASGFVLRYAWKTGQAENAYDYETQIGLSIVAGLLSVLVGLCIIGSHMYNFVLCAVAPKLFLLNYLKEMLK